MNCGAVGFGSTVIASAGGQIPTAVFWVMHAIGREIYHAGLTTIILTSTHAQASQAQRLRTDWSLFLNELKNASERLTRKQCWEWIWERNLTPFRKLEAARRT